MAERTPLTLVALDRLSRDPLNVRKSYRAEGLAELAASIKARGLIENLVVRKARKRGHFYVTAGGRRLAAMQALAASGDLPADHPMRVIECAEADAVEISLHENITAEAMHPLDEFEAFSALVTERVPVAEIAARFGKTPAYVRQRTALARVSPLIRDAYRREECDFAVLAAFTVSDDHGRQEAVWRQLPTWQRYPETIRRLLTASAIPAHDRRLCFVGGLEAYEAAGGPVKRDLFDADRSAGYALDAALLERLVGERLDARAAAIRAEGWQWVETRHDIDWSYLSTFRRLDAEPAALTDAEEAARDVLLGEREELEALVSAGADDEAGAAEARMSEIDRLLEAYDAPAFTEAEKAGAGAIVALTYHGEAQVYRGLCRITADEAAGGGGPVTPASDPASGAERTTPDAPAEAPGLTHSATLLEDLSAQKTAALRAELAHNHDVALCAVVHALLLRLVYPCAIVSSALEIRATHTDLAPSLKMPGASPALAEWQRMAENYGFQLPGDPADLWEHLSGLSQDALLALLAFAASHTVNAVQKPHDARPEARHHADDLGQALGVEMRRWFTPTGASYFQHISRAGIAVAVAEAVGAAGRRTIEAAGRKAEAVAIAERLVAGTDWLPLPVRFPAPADGGAYRHAAE